MKNKIQAIILAAGKSTRFNTGKTKLIEPLCGQAIILYITHLLESLAIDTSIVVGHEQEAVKECVTKAHNSAITFVTQTEQRGTGHALGCTEKSWTKDHILVINGDMPLVKADTITDLYNEHISKRAAISFITAHNPNKKNNPYGRVVFTENTIAIVEAKDFVGDINQKYPINAGIYIIEKQFLSNFITTLKSNNNSNEFYITDLIAIASNNGDIITTLEAPFETICGINTVQELYAAEQIQKQNLAAHWMNNGVRFACTNNLSIDTQVTIDKGSYIGYGTHLRGATQIGQNCRIEEFSVIDSTTIEDNVTVYSHSLIKNSIIKEHAEVGPFAHVRMESIIGRHAAVGNFVEVKKSSFGHNSKVKHLSYFGDATVGDCVNIGALTVTCNYNGITKEQTIIKNNAFIGSSNTIVAPITIGENAFTAAGSTITVNVPDNALAIARSHQTNKPDYAHKLLMKKKTDKKIISITEENECFAHHKNDDSINHSFSFIGARLINHDIPSEEQ